MRTARDAPQGDFLPWPCACPHDDDQDVSPSPALPTKRAHWPALDGWRGFTIWFAISVHAGYFTAGGVLSLDTFFVLSGFLITGLLIREWDRSAGIDLLAFWARRARRLLPALFVVLGAVLVYAAVLAPSLGLDKLRADVLASLGYVVNWHFILSGQSYFGAFTTPSPLLHLWSLAVEEQFYLIWPPVVLGTLWLARRCGVATRRDRDRRPARALRGNRAPRSGWSRSTRRAATPRGCTTAPTPAPRPCSSARCSQS